MKRATVYHRKSQFFVHASCRTTAGVWIFGLPFVALEQSCNDASLGDAVCAALAGSRHGIPHPLTWTGLLTPLLDAAGVRTWNTFAKSASCVEIEEQDGHISVVPTRNLGPEEGFQPEPSRSSLVDLGANVMLGSMVRRLLLDS
jgi:hypothetical protein